MPRRRRNNRRRRLRFHVPPKPMLQSDEVLLRDLRRVARMLGTDRLSSRDYQSHGEPGGRRFGAQVYRQRFGSWAEAIRRAGLSAASARLTTRELHMNMYALWQRFKGKPSVEKVNRRNSRAGWSVYVRRFGSWHRAQLAFIAWIRRPGNEQRARREWQRNEREQKRAQRYSIRPSSPSRSRMTGSDADLPRAGKARPVTLAMRFTVLRRDRYRCRACGRSPANDPKVELHVDHIRPVSRGGNPGRGLRNLQTLCRDCNLGKSNRTGTRDSSTPKAATDRARFRPGGARVCRHG